MEYQPFAYAYHPNTAHTPTHLPGHSQHGQVEDHPASDQPYDPRHAHIAHQHFSPAPTPSMEQHSPQHHPHPSHPASHPSLTPYTPYPQASANDHAALPFSQVDFPFYYPPRPAHTDRDHLHAHAHALVPVIVPDLPSPLPAPAPDDETGSDEQTPYADIPGKTNWQPGAALPDDPTVSDPTPPSPRLAARLGRKGSSARQAKSALPSRSKRAAASRARSNIASYATQMRSLPALSVSTGASVDSRPVSRATSGGGHHSRASSRASFHPSESASMASYRPSGTYPTDPSMPLSSILRVTIGSEPARGRKAPTQQITLKNHRGYLLPVEPGVILEVNDLLILQPPSLEPADDGTHAPRNQYTDAAPCPDGYRSMYEMYTCRVCSKTYDGKNARSVARRHLQDKHGVPLAMQKRRTRWDGGQSRTPTRWIGPSGPSEIGRRSVGQSHRLCMVGYELIVSLLARLERAHVAFLERYGPRGITAPTKTHLIAPTMRDRHELLGTNQYLPGDIGWGDMPKHLREGIAQIEGIALPFPFALEEASPSRMDVADNAAPPPSFQRIRHDRRGKNESISTTSSAASSASDQSAGTQRGVVDLLARSPSRFAHSPSRFAHSAPEFGLTRTPTSNSRDPGAMQTTLPSRADWTSWGAASFVSEAALRTVMAHHYANMPMSAEDAIASDFAVQATLAADSGSEKSARASPEPLVSIDEVGAETGQGWSVDDTMWYSLAAPSDTPVQTYGFPTPSEFRRWIQQDPSPVRNETMGSEADAEGEVEVEAVAAESLLNLHSTPARPEEPRSVSDPCGPKGKASSNEGSPKQSHSSSLTIRPLLSGPDATPGPTRPVRAQSLVQPFAKGRQDAWTRSLSLTQTLDDPFAFTPSSVFRPSASNKKKRRSTIASPSPLASKRKKERDAARGRDPWPRAALSSIHPNSENGANVGEYDPPLHSGGSALASAGPSNVPSSGISGLSSFTLLAAPYVTPMKPLRGQDGPLGPSSAVSKPWQFSSPGDGGMAASLGLVPQWGGVSGTPGVSGIEAGETPERRR